MIRLIQGNLIIEPIQVLHKPRLRTCSEMGKLRRTVLQVHATAGQGGPDLWRFIDIKTIESQLVAALTAL
ncbi:MAG: hypothetical protein H0T87_09090 [Gammaproteobacteria bacterium]|nr:hypothetical protein [Gammaproteobacteria bacterium]